MHKVVVPPLTELVFFKVLLLIFFEGIRTARQLMWHTAEPISGVTNKVAFGSHTLKEPDQVHCEKTLGSMEGCPRLTEAFSTNPRTKERSSMRAHVDMIFTQISGVVECGKAVLNKGEDHAKTTTDIYNRV